MSPTQRAACMFKLADLIEAHAEEFAQLESLDVGKTITSARAIDVPFTVYSGDITRAGQRNYTAKP